MLSACSRIAGPSIDTPAASFARSQRVADGATGARASATVHDRPKLAAGATIDGALTSRQAHSLSGVHRGWRRRSRSYRAHALAHCNPAVRP